MGLFLNEGENGRGEKINKYVRGVVNLWGMRDEGEGCDKGGNSGNQKG